MKQVQKITLALVAALSLSTVGLASAATSSTWTVGSTFVPSSGSGGVTNKSNLKKTNSNYASFNGDAMPNFFGYSVTLVNNRNENRSSTVGLVKDKTVHASNNSGVKNKHYWARVNSKKYEPHDSNVKLHFSADKK